MPFLLRLRWCFLLLFLLKNLNRLIVTNTQIPWVVLLLIFPLLSKSPDALKT